MKSVKEYAAESCRKPLRRWAKGSGGKGGNTFMSNNWKERRSRALKQMRNDWLLYLLLVPVLAWYIIFC